MCVGAATTLMRCAYLEDEGARAEAVLVVLRHDHTLCKVSGDLRLDGGHHLELGAAAAARAPKDGELLRVALWMERNRGGATEHGHKASESTKG